jgi:hypothetical protein
VSRAAARRRWSVGRDEFGHDGECCVPAMAERVNRDQGQVLPPFESAAVLSPLPQMVNVPVEVALYL